MFEISACNTEYIIASQMFAKHIDIAQYSSSAVFLILDFEECWYML